MPPGPENITLRFAELDDLQRIETFMLHHLTPAARSLRFNGEISCLPDNFGARLRGELPGRILLAEERSQIVGVADYGYEDTTTAEIAVVVADQQHCRGIGSALLSKFVEHATEEGITTVVAYYAKENKGAARLLSSIFGTNSSLQYLEGDSGTNSYNQITCRCTLEAPGKVNEP